MNDNYKLNFGEFKGCKLEDIPLKYLDWLLGLKTNMPYIPTIEIEKYLSDPLLKKELERQLECEEDSF